MKRRLGFLLFLSMLVLAFSAATSAAAKTVYLAEKEQFYSYDQKKKKYELIWVTDITFDKDGRRIGESGKTPKGDQTAKTTTTISYKNGQMDTVTTLYTVKNSRNQSYSRKETIKYSYQNKLQVSYTRETVLKQNGGRQLTEKGKVVNAFDKKGNLIGFKEYDAAGKLVSSTAYTLDKNGRTIRIVQEVSGRGKNTSSISYYSDGALKTVTAKNADGTSSITDYNPYSLITKVRTTRGGITTTDSYSYSYYKKGFPKEKVHSVDGKIIEKTVYSNFKAFAYKQ
jgi:YD repeat-containing protein